MDGSDPPGSFLNLDGRLLNQARTARTELFLVICLGSLSGICQVFQAWLLSRLVSRAFLGMAWLQDLALLFLGFLVVAIFKAVLVWGTQVTANKAAGKVKKTLREHLTDHLIELGPAFIQQERTGELTNTATEGIESLTSYISEYLPQIALASLVPVTVLLFIFPLDPLTGIILILTAPLIPVFMWLIGSIAKGMSQKQWLETSRMSAHFLDMLQGLATLKTLGKSAWQALSIERVADQFRRTTLNVLKVTFLSALVLEMAATISTAVIAVQIGLRLLHGNLEFQPAFFILLLAPEFYQPLRKLGTRFHTGMAGVTAAARLFQILEKQACSKVVLVERNIPVPAGDICLTDVSYVYEVGNRPALNHFSLNISAGRCVALVGPSGAGKSTVAHLLLRFIEPDQGFITVGETRLDTIPVSTWRSQVSWVSQNPYLFNGTVLDNIGLGMADYMDEPDTKEFDRIEWAAHQAHAHEFIQKFPQGYQTIIGENAQRLSGGQAQRIALARAFVKDSPILILDEATANLDTGHEIKIRESLERLISGRTALVIAHRLNTIANADRIIVMHAGRLVESGTYRELAQKGGLFSQLDQAYTHGSFPNKSWSMGD